MKHLNKLLFLSISFFLIGCNQQPQPKPKPIKINSVIKNFVEKNVTDVNSTNKIAKYLDKPVNVKAVKKVLLKTSPNYAKHHKKEAIKEVIRVKPNMPVYQEPLFAEMYVMPYVSDNGIYHDVQKVYIKVKNGEWVLNTKNKQKNEKIFNLE
jgi:hypothetical protein